RRADAHGDDHDANQTSGGSSSSGPPDEPPMTFVLILLLSSILHASAAGADSRPGSPRPNVVLIMTDDQGWADAGYMGHPVLRTPHLDEMARGGIRFERFYAAAPVCSPTRGSVLTGRHPFRYGITNANVGHLPEDEQTIAEILREHGYRTGHFGKWHLGTLTTVVRDGNRGGPRAAEHDAPPWKHGFDVCFSTEAKVPTAHPMITPTTIEFGGANGTTPGDRYGTAYWTGPDTRVDDNLDGDDARVIMDRVIPFIDDAVSHEAPFLAVIWFHSPHLPVVAEDADRAPYALLDEYAQHYFGCLTAMDEQVGRLRARLRALGIADDTIVWFCSDNGPEGQARTAPGSAGPLRGRKRSLYEGGVRVPGLLEWPARFPEPRVIAAPAVTSDILPTVLHALDIDGAPTPLDGIDLMPLLEGTTRERHSPIGFRSGKQATWVADRYKLVVTTTNQGDRVELFDLVADPSEQTDLAALHPDLVTRLHQDLDAWIAACDDDRDEHP
ncbi:MAG: sulfatase-like hydrolase/transferase, partial [Phycisphaerales bacterium]|nr:sulfatase-like hydrolase/transferase [Phycisphaerales bacterium]